MEQAFEPCDLSVMALGKDVPGVIYKTAVAANDVFEEALALVVVLYGQRSLRKCDFDHSAKNLRHEL
jgi:hypothetical protein